MQEIECNPMAWPIVTPHVVCGLLWYAQSFLRNCMLFCCMIFVRDLLRRFHAFLPLLWDVLMQIMAFWLHAFLMRSHAIFEP